MGYKLTYTSPKGQSEEVTKTVYRSEAITKMFDDIVWMAVDADSNDEASVNMIFTGSSDLEAMSAVVKGYGTWTMSPISDEECD